MVLVLIILDCVMNNDGSEIETNKKNNEKGFVYIYSVFLNA